MARSKVIVKYIANDSTRKATCKKRTMGVIKKAGELSILCDVDVCVFILPEGESQAPQVWPSLPEATRMVDRLRAMPELDQCKKKMDGEAYVRERISKMEEQLRKAERENRQRETTLLLHDAMAGRRNLEGRSGLQARVQADPPHYAATLADVEAPHQQQGRFMEPGWDLNAAASIGSLGGTGGHDSAGAMEDVMHLGNMDDGEFAWAAQGIHFPPF